jgi:hypothetical protein
MAVRWAITGGTWSSTSTWNDGATLGIPTVGDDVYSNGFTVLVNTGFTVNSLNNSARDRTIFTPQMTANNVPSPFVAASSSQSGGQSPFLAFNRNRSTSDYWNSAAVAAWLSIDFGLGNSEIIDGYTIYGYNNQGFNPRNWTFEGSNDNSIWFILHTVTGSTAIAASGTYSVASIGNPTAYRYYRVNITANGGQPTDVIVELELYQPGTAALVAGGSFNFNTSGVIANITSSTPLNLGATNLIQVTASAGTVSINLGGNVLFVGFSTCISHTGNCNFNLSGNSFINNTSGGITGRVIISKTSAGLITITGNLTGGDGASGGFSGNHAFSSTNGNSIIIGNITGGGPNSGNGNNGNNGVTQTSGSLTIIGNITGGLSAAARGVLFLGTQLNVIGSCLGVGGSAISTSSQVNVITGNVTAGTVQAIDSSSANIINVNGNAIASATANAISMTNANGQVYLNGNMTNVNGKMAIYAPIIWLDQTGTTQARFFTSGGADRTLYSDNTFPNQPPLSDVRYLTKFGPSSGLTGTLRMASPTDVRSGVATDNTVGTALFDTSQLLAELNASSDPIAQRLRIAATPEILGQLLAAYKR